MAVSAWAGPVTATTLAAAPTGLPMSIRVGGVSTSATAWVKTASGKVALNRPAVSGPALVPELPWVMPSRTTMAASGKDVLAYFHTFPIYGNTYDTWLLPSSAPEVGGKWRQRPYPFVTAANNTERVARALEDITVAANIGIDAFTFNVGSTRTIGDTFRWTEHYLPHYDAAAQFSANNTPGFKICPNLQMLSIANRTATADKDPITWADAIKELLDHPAAYKRAGRPVVCIYNVDNMPAQWYRDVHTRLVAQGVTNPAFIPSHQATSPTGGGNIDNYLSLFTDGIFTHLHPWDTPSHTVATGSIYSTWRTWTQNNSTAFCAGVGPRWENDRPEDLKQVEGYGTRILENQWTSARVNGDPMVQIISWSDHLESHNIRPSTGYQFTPYDITAYYLAWYKTGTAPTITRDAVFYAHRMHAGAASYSTSTQTAGAYNVAFGPVADKVITTAFLTEAADVIVTVGGSTYTHAAPAGYSRWEDPFAANVTPTFKVRRAGVDVVPQFSSAFPTRSAITYQDLLYRMGSSTRAPMVGVQSDLPQDR